MKKTLAILLALLMTLGMAVGVSAEAPAPIPGGTITISDYYDPPPAINGNPVTPSGDDAPTEFCFDRLVEYAPVPEESYTWFLATGAEQDGDRTIVKLREDAKWSDGTPLTAKDVVANYNIRYIVQDSVWQYLTKVEAIDDYTVAFVWHTFSPLMPRMAYNVTISMSYADYGKWSDAVQQYIDKRVWDDKQQVWSDAPADWDEVLKLKEEVFAFLPDVTTMKTTGAYKVASVNANELMLAKNEFYYNADKVMIDNVRVQRYVSAEAYLTTVMNGGYDTEPHGLTPDLFAQLEANNPQMVTMWVPDLGQPAFQFNITKYPLNIPQVRQAIGYIIDREALLEIAEPGTLTPDYYATGLTPLWRDAYLTPEIEAKLANYIPDEAKATELLESIGWTKGSDGYWQDENGQTIEIEVSSMNSWPIFFACGEAASLMMDEFGLKSTFNAMELTAYWQFIDNGDAMISCDFRGGTTQRGPWEAFSGTYIWSNNRIGLNPQGSASDYPIIVTKLDGTEVDVRAQLYKMFYGTEEENKEAIETMMLLSNEQVFILPIGEKYAPMKIHNPKLAYPTDPNSPLWYMGHMRAYGRLLKTGSLYFTE